MKVWVCLVRREVFVGGESQRCRHTRSCTECGGTGAWPKSGPEDICLTCKGTGQVSECGVMELIGGEPMLMTSDAKPPDRIQGCNCAAIHDGECMTPEALAQPVTNFTVTFRCDAKPDGETL